MTGARIAVFGLGRSGLSVGRAAKRRGALVRVVDQKSLDRLAKPQLYYAAIEEGIEVELNWGGRFHDVDLVVSNPAVPRDHRALREALSAGIEVVSEIEFAYRISEAPIVAITGTNGKSTTTVMTYLALKAAEVDAVLCGNLYGSGYPEMTLTEAADGSNADQVLVAEVSSFQLEWVSKFRPVSAGITTVTADHLDRYGGSFEEYLATKRRIFAAQTEADFAVVRSDDVSVRDALHSNVLTFGKEPADAVVDARSITVLGTQISLEECSFREAHNVLNAATALLLSHGALVATNRATEFDVRLVEGIRKFRGLDHRMQQVGSRNGVAVINNSMCTNPDAVIQSTKSIPGLVNILLGGLNKGLDFESLGEYLRSTSHRAFLFGTERDNLNAMMGTAYPTFATMEEAFRAATGFAQPGETIVLSPGCASSDQFKDFVDRGNVFVALAKEWLSNESCMEAI